jgi:single-strand DNA-binding protein
MNNATLIGRIVRDAELKELDGGRKVINFSMAVDDGKDKPAIFFDCAKWSEKTGVLPYLKKGVQVAVTGNVGIRKWDTAQSHGAALTLRVIDLQLLGGGDKQPLVPAEGPGEIGHSDLGF